MRPSGLPVRGPAVRSLDLPLPPAAMPLLRRGRPLKRWRYTGVYGPELMLCAGDARIGLLPRRWWAIALPGGRLVEDSSLGRGGLELEEGRLLLRGERARVELHWAEDGGMEVVSPHGSAWIWTRKRAPLAVSGEVELDGERFEVDCDGFVDESAGYHARATAWTWSAGVGRGTGGERLAWNLVTGVHDVDGATELTLWVDGREREIGPVEFAPDLSSVSFSEGGRLSFDAWASRDDDTNLLIMRSRYRQPFGTFTGEFPGGPRLAEGYGVMEEHDVRW